MCSPVPQCSPETHLSPLSYLEAVGQEELQLAMALSGSLHQQTTPTDPAPMPQGKRGTRGRTTRANERDLLPASVLATSPAESQKILAQRASDILQENVSIIILTKNFK